MALATIRTDVWDVIYNALQTGTYAITTNNIHSAMNAQQIKDEGYPQVIIYPPAIETELLDFAKELHKKKVNIMIEIYDKSAANVKTVTDEIEYQMSLAEKEKVWADEFLFNMEIDDNDYDFWTENKKTIHRATLNFNFTYMKRL